MEFAKGNIKLLLLLYVIFWQNMAPYGGGGSGLL